MGEKKSPCGNVEDSHPGFKEKVTLFAPKVTFGAKNKPLREARGHNTLVLKRKVIFERKKSPCGKHEAITPWF